MSFEISPFDSEFESQKRPEENVTTSIPLKEFIAGLEERGFQPGTKDLKIFQHPSFPKHRICIEDNKVQIERVFDKDRDKKWQVNDTYLISKDLHMALSAVDLILDQPVIIKKRKSLSSIESQAIGILMGPISTYVGIRLLMLDVEDCDLAILFLFITLLGPFLVIYSAKKHLQFRKFQRSSVVTAGKIVKKEIKKVKSKRRIHVHHSLIIHFEIPGEGSEGEQINLSIPVSEEFYRSNLTGSTVMVEYASKDPTIAHIEGEF